MTNRKSTRRALTLSVISLLLCVAMLVGTTYAWFTDSVTSSNNIIKSGNLDIELEYWNGTKWVDVAGKSDILTNTLCFLLAVLGFCAHFNATLAVLKYTAHSLSVVDYLRTAGEIGGFDNVKQTVGRGFRVL